MTINPEYTLDGLEYSFYLPNKYDWYGLEARCFLFEDGWRVPTRCELINLFDSTPESRDNYLLWSCLADGCENTDAWFVHFYFGYSLSSDRAYHYHVRLVRDV